MVALEQRFIADRNLVQSIGNIRSAHIEMKVRDGPALYRRLEKVPNRLQALHGGGQEIAFPAHFFIILHGYRTNQRSKMPTRVNRLAWAMLRPIFPDGDIATTYNAMVSIRLRSLRDVARASFTHITSRRKFGLHSQFDRPRNLDHIVPHRSSGYCRSGCTRRRIGGWAGERSEIGCAR